MSELARHGRVFVPSEAPTPDEIKPHASTMPVHKIHNLMPYAKFAVGESATIQSHQIMNARIPILVQYPFCPSTPFIHSLEIMVGIKGETLSQRSIMQF